MLQVAVKGRGHDLPLVAPVQDDMAGQGQQQQQEFVLAPQVTPRTLAVAACRQLPALLSTSLL